MQTNNTLLLKRIDLWAQVVAFFMPMLVAVLTGEGGYVFAIYLTVGSFQFISCVLNRIFLPRQFRCSTRIVYEIILLIVAIISLILFLTSKTGGDGPFTWAVIMVFLSPLMAIWYTINSYLELDAIKMQTGTVKYPPMVLNSTQEPLLTEDNATDD